MELNDIEVGDVIVALHDKPKKNGIIGHVYIYLGHDKLFHVARAMINGTWVSIQSSFIYSWKQLSSVLGGVHKGTYKKISQQKLRLTIIKTFYPENN